MNKKIAYNFIQEKAVEFYLNLREKRRLQNEIYRYRA